MKFEVPQRQQLASERTSLTLFAPALSTTSFVPLTRNLSPANPSPTRGWTGLSEATATRFSVLRTTKCDAFSEARRTKNRLLRYGIRIRCSKRLTGVRDAFSEAFGVKNRLLRYGRDIRYRKRPPTVRDASSKVRRTADSTDCGQPPAAPDASSVRETAPALFVRSGGPFPCSFDGTRCQKRPPLGCEQAQKDL